MPSMLGPVYRMLGLTVGAVTRPLDQAQRRAAYGCDIAYCTAKELIFDYLRDRLVRRAPAQRAARPRAPPRKRQAESQPACCCAGCGWRWSTRPTAF